MEAQGEEATEETGFTVGVMAERLRAGIVLVTNQIGDGFQSVMMMYTVAFYMGVALIAVAVASSLVIRESTISLLTGGVGLADVVTLLIFQPAEKLQISRGNLAQLEAAYSAWINDIHNWNLYWRRAVADSAKSIDELRKVSDTMMDNTERIMKLIDMYVEGKSPGTALAPRPPTQPQSKVA